MLRAARRQVVEVAEECDPCRVLDAARAGHEGREGLREEELVDAREVAHDRAPPSGGRAGVFGVAFEDDGRAVTAVGTMGAARRESEGDDEQHG